MKILCLILGHKLFIAQTLSPSTRRICCKRCNKSYAMHDETRTCVRWDSQFHEMYERHGVKVEYLDCEFKHT